MEASNFKKWPQQKVVFLFIPKHSMYGLGGGFKYFLFSTLLGEMVEFDKYFSDGLKPPPTVVHLPTFTINITHM